MNERLPNELPRHPQVAVGAATGGPLPEDLVVEYERLEVSAHPFFVGLRARPVDLGAIWILVANLRAGISRDFIVWLAQTIARVSDRRVACLLAKQLNDELGNGDLAQIHSVLLERFLEGLQPWRPEGEEEAMVRPGGRLAERATGLFQTADPHEALGALMVGEIFAKKMDHCLGDEIRRQDGISAHALTWLTIHEVLEVDHADDARELAALVPDGGAAIAATWRGAEAQWRTLWEFLDGVQSVSASLRHLHNS
jgi:pyrroloquinoline quinone (PQQ) biosynthesis protein C